MHLLELPVEIISSIPPFIRNIEDFTNFSSTCRALHNIFSSTHPKTILRLADASAPTFFSPHPHFLVASTARELSSWAIQSDENTDELRKAFQSGIDGLYELCLSKCGLTLAQIRHWHSSRFRIINPLSNEIDKMAGQQWYSTPNFWNGGVSEPYTVHSEPDRQTFQIIIYGELFASTMDAWLQPERSLPWFDMQTRLDFVKYCIPDWCCEGGYPGLEVLATGPYAPLPEGERREYVADQGALDHILNCGRWQRPWNRVCTAINIHFADEWKQKMWFDAVQMQGLEGMEAMLSEAGLQRQRANLERIYSQINALEEQQKPATNHIGRCREMVSDAPDFSNEVHVCVRSLWPGTG